MILADPVLQNKPPVRHQVTLSVVDGHDGHFLTTSRQATSSMRVIKRNRMLVRSNLEASTGVTGFVVRKVRMNRGDT